MKMKERIEPYDIELRRLHNVLGSTITWEVISNGGKIRRGVIERRKSAWLSKTIGWKRIPIYYWIGHLFIPQTVVVANSRRELLRNMGAIKWH